MESSEEPSRQALDIKVLSPSPEVGAAGLFFENVPVTSTVAEFKARIREALPTRPGPERQRLIYLGRALARDQEPLGEVFGRNAVRDGCRPALGVESALSCC